MTYSELKKEAEYIIGAMGMWGSASLQDQDWLIDRLTAFRNVVIADSESDLDRWAESVRRLEKAQGKIKAKAYEDAAKYLETRASSMFGDYNGSYLLDMCARELRARAEEAGK